MEKIGREQREAGELAVKSNGKGCKHINSQMFFLSFSYYCVVWLEI